MAWHNNIEHIHLKLRSSFSVYTRPNEALYPPNDNFSISFSISIQNIELLIQQPTHTQARACTHTHSYINTLRRNITQKEDEKNII